MITISPDDTKLKQRVLTYLQQRLPALDKIEVEIEHSSVILRGAVSCRSDKWRSVDACRHIAGVLNVIDQLAVTSPDGIDAAQQNLPFAQQEPMRVLLVDDNSDVTRAWAKLLNRTGYEALAAGTGQDALAAVKDFSPAIICLDLRLPDMSGYELANRLRNEVGTPALIIAISGSALDPAKAAPASINRHFLKPVSLPEVLKSVTAELSSPQGHG